MLRFTHKTLFLISCAWLGTFGAFAGLDDLEDINFPLNSSVVVDGFPSLDLLAEVMANHSNLDLEVIGHTDSLGTASYNKGLSKRRAEAVKQYLVNKGVSASQLTTKGEGIDRSYDNSNREGRFRNRRVSLVLFETLNGTRSKVSYQRLLRLFFGDSPEMKTLSEVKTLEGQDRLMQKLSDLEGRLNDMRDAFNKRLGELTRPAATGDTQPKSASVHMPIGSGYSGVSIAAGADDEGDFVGQVRGLYFRKLSDNAALQAEGDFSYYDALQEGQVDLAFVYQRDWFKAAAAGSYKWVSIDNLEAARLAQAAFITDFHFDSGKFGLFATFPIADGDVVFSGIGQSAAFLREITVEVPTQIGLDFGVSLGQKVDLSGYLANLETEVSDEDLSAGLRLDIFLKDYLSWYFDIEQNPGPLALNDEGRRYMTGLRFGSWNKARYNLGSEITPVNVPNIRYELVARETRVGNSPPVAVAGQSRVNVPAGTVTLDGSGSSDPDGDTLNYRWTQISGPTVTLNSPNQAITTFDGVAGESYVFQLAVRDNSNESASDNVSIAMEAAPIPEVQVLSFAAVPSTIDLGELSQLSWSTRDADEVTISGFGNVGPNGALLVSPETDTEYVLTASNAAGSVSQSVNITVIQPPPPPPLPDPVINFLTAIPDEITEGEFTTLSWSTSDATEVELEGLGRVEPSGSLILSPRETTTYNLTASNGEVTVDQSITVTVNPLIIDPPPPPNQPPTANAGGDITISRPGVVTLNGSGSSDPENEPLIYEWTQLSGLPVTLTGANTAMPSFEATSGSYVFKLTVTDSGGASDDDEVTVSVVSVKR